MEGPCCQSPGRVSFDTPRSPTASSPKKLTHPPIISRSATSGNVSPSKPASLRRTNSEPAPNTPPDSTADASRKWLGLVRKGCYAGVQASMREGWAPVNATDAVGYTALMRCCVSGQLLEVLLGCSECDVNLTHAGDGATALLLAARHRSARTVHSLLRRGALFTRDGAGCSVLHKAATNADPAVVRLLLQAQADPCARDREGRCALATAVLHGNEATAIALLQWQESWAAKGVLRAATAAEIVAGRASTESSGGATSRTSDGGGSADGAADADGGAGGGPPLRIDSLPDDCLELILLHLDRIFPPSTGSSSATPSSPRAAGGARAAPAGGVGDAAGGPVLQAGGGGGAGGGGAGVGHAVDGGAIVASVAASVAASTAEREAGMRGGRSAIDGSAVPLRVPAMACVCVRLRTVCRRRAIAAWLAVDGVNAPVVAYHPRGHVTTLLHVAAAEGMEGAMDMLLRRGARPLAVDSSRRTPLQVARGRASLVAKLMHAQGLAERALQEDAPALGGAPVELM